MRTLYSQHAEHLPTQSKRFEGCCGVFAAESAMDDNQQGPTTKTSPLGDNGWSSGPSAYQQQASVERRRLRQVASQGNAIIRH